MERKLVSIQKVLNIEPISGADAIECLTILGWKVVAKKNQFHVGDLVCYCEVDSILPDTPNFEFLRKVNFRVKTIRLKGQVSQGIVFPISILPLPVRLASGGEIHDCSLQLDITEGDDVTALLKVTKYEPYIPAQLAGTVKGNFPSFLHKTDEMRIQAVPEILNNYTNVKFYVTEKIDGSSMTVYLNEGEFGVCSRNLDLKETESNSFWKLARELDLENKLRSCKLMNVALQGELVGPGVQGNKYQFDKLHFFVFNVFNIAVGLNLSYSDFTSVTSYLGLEIVPLLDSDFTLLTTVDELVEYSRAVSILNNVTHREGVVIRPLIEVYSEELRSRLSFKVINPDFLLKYNE